MFLIRNEPLSRLCRRGIVFLQVHTSSGRFSRLDPKDMGVHARESEVLVKDIKCSKFNMCQAEGSLSLSRGFGRSECLADEGRNLLGAFSWYRVLQTASLTKSGVRTNTSRARPSTCPRTLWAFSEACVKLGTAHRPENEAPDTHTVPPPAIVRVRYQAVCWNSLLIP